MTDQNTSPVGEPSSSKPDEDDVNQPDTGVTYDTHRKLLSEKKKLSEKYAQQAAELEKFKAAQNEAEEHKLKEANDWASTLKANAEERVQKAENEKNELFGQISNAKKLNAVLKGVQGTIPDKYFNLIDTSSIVIDPETGDVDPATVSKAVEVFQANFPEVIQTKGKNFPASTAPDNSSSNGPAALDDFLKMNKSERAKNMHLLDLPEEAKFLL